MPRGTSVKAGGRRKTSVWMADQVVRQLKACADLEGRPASMVVEQAIKEYLRKQPKARASA